MGGGGRGFGEFKQVIVIIIVVRKSRVIVVLTATIVIIIILRSFISLRGAIEVVIELGEQIAGITAPGVGQLPTLT